MAKGTFITGTDTDVGKTFVSGILMYLMRKNGYNGCYFKAALSGAEEREKNLIPTDAEFVKSISEIDEKYENMVPYVYKTPVSPHLASKIENNPIRVQKILETYNNLKEKYDYILAEGSGGIVYPLIYNEKNNYFLEHLIKDLNMDVIVVSKSGLGTINHTILTIDYIRKAGIEVKGLIFNEYENTILCNNNIEVIQSLTKIPILAKIPSINKKDYDIYNIGNLWQKYIDIKKILNLMKNL